MKTHIADPATRTWCVRIETKHGAVIRLTSHPRDLPMSGQVYLSQSGYEFTGRSDGTNFSPGVMDLQGIANIAGVGYDALASGLFDGARVYVFATSWASPVEDDDPIGAALLGKTRLEDDRYVIEMMSLIDALNQSVGRTYTAACGKAFGGQEYAGCGIDLPSITVTGAITSVTDASTVRDASRAEVADWFGNGTLTFTTGANAGRPALQIKRHEADGTIEFSSPAYYMPQIGDQYTAVPGCRKRRDEDCRDKWNNVLNCGAFKDVPVGSTYAQVGGS